MSHRRRARSVIASTILAAVPLSGCVTWRATATPMEELLRTDQPRALRVTTVDGLAVVVRSPTLTDEFLVGEAPDEGVRVQLARIGRVEVRAVNAFGTTAILVGAGLVAISPLRFTIGCYTGLSACGS